MRQLTHASEFRDALQKVKSERPSFATNFYATPEAIDGWIARGRLFLEEREGCLLLFRRDQDFHHLHYAAADSGTLAAALGDRRAPWRSGTVTADLIGREADLGITVETFVGAGFYRHASLVRMSRIGDSSSPEAYADPEVVFAEPQDAPAIHTFLAQLLDRYSEQLPDLEEIHAALSHRGLLVLRRGEDLGGVLFFETTGLTSVLRYWFVNDRFRNLGIGARLIRTYFRLCKASKRIVLWVISDNDDAIAKYEHYRFRREGLVDHVVIRKGDTAS